MHLKGSVYYHVTSTGGKRKWTKLSSSYAEALAKWSEIEGSVSSGETVSEAIDRYLIEVLPRLAKKTQAEYGRQASLLRGTFSEFRLDQVRPTHIAQYLDERDAKVAANREMSLLSTIYSHAMRWGWVDSNSCRGVARNPEEERDRYITDTELQRLRNAANEQFRCMIDLSYLTAMRRGDILRLTLADVRQDGLHVVHQKTGKRLVYELTPRLSALINRIRRLRRRVRTVFLFATRDGQPYSESGFESGWRRLVQRSGVEDVHFHDIRAKAITDAKRQRGLDDAQALGGHESRDTTEGYVKAREVERV